ncbi:hypothetical protein B5C34_04500 [Pacificimonas flava]|uniref:Leucine-binding protein domain-containing protein n=2 Tax=Pacificimonas TaxID=1960290 RepID=A0A219B8Z9_9SPHN|nr:hypothetical protein B5C34_04500 [Pacificimonas flava]
MKGAVATGRPLLCAALAMLTLSACQSFGPSDDDAQPAPPPPPVEETEAAPPPPPPEPEEAPAHQVALLLPLSGQNERVGRSLASAAAMALADTGSEEIELRTYDTEGSGGAAGAARRAVADGAKLFLGPLLAEHVREVRGVASSESIPIISFSNDAGVAGNGVYLLGFQPDQSISRVVRFARSQGVRDFAALVPQGIYGRRASQAFLDAVRSAGGRVTAIETFERRRSALAGAARRLTDYDARSARAAEGGVVRRDGTVANVEDRLPPVAFDALLIADGGEIAAEFLTSLDRFDAGPGDVRYLGTELWNADPRVARIEGLRGSWFASVSDSRFARLAQRFEQRFGGRPSRLASLAYDAVLLTVGLADEWPEGGDFPDSALTDPDGFVGIDGIFRFGSNGIAQRGMEVQEIGPNGARVVAPAPKSFEQRISSREAAPRLEEEEVAVVTIDPALPVLMAAPAL